LENAQGIKLDNTGFCHVQTIISIYTKKGLAKKGREREFSATAAASDHIKDTKQTHAHPSQ
jgi:hypothetical protein